MRKPITELRVVDGMLECRFITGDASEWTRLITLDDIDKVQKIVLQRATRPDIEIQRKRPNPEHISKPMGGK